MITGLIIKAFALTAWLIVCGVALFVFLNKRDATRDNKSYEEDYKINDHISQQYIYRGTNNPTVAPNKALKRYAMNSRQQPSAQKLVKDSVKIATEKAVSKSNEDDSKPATLGEAANSEESKLADV